MVKIKSFILRICIFLLIISLLPIVASAAPETPGALGEQVLEGGKQDFVWPVPGYCALSSCFSDSGEAGALGIHSEVGASVVASYAGKVLEIYAACTHSETEQECDCPTQGRGNYVLLEHTYLKANGETVTLQSRYSHLNTVSVEAEQEVAAGASIGTVGATGNSTEACLTFEIMYAQQSVDPYSNKLLALPAELTGSKECCGQYVAAVKELYTPDTPDAPCQQHTYDAQGSCTACASVFDFESTRTVKQMGKYKPAAEGSVLAFSTPYEAGEGMTLGFGGQIPVLAQVINAHGAAWYEIKLDDGTKAYISAATLTFDAYEQSIIQGELQDLKNGDAILRESRPLKGWVNSNYPLASIVGKLDGVEYASWTAAEGQGERLGISLYETALNTELRFRNMSFGVHTLVVTVSNSAGEVKDVISCTFEIVEKITEPEPEKPKFTITLAGMNGQTVIVEEGQPLGKLPVPEATEVNLYFSGWYTAEQNGERVTDAFVPTADMTLYPLWVPKDETHLVTFDGEEKFIPFGTAIGKLPVPEKAGHRFLGWFAEDGVQVTEQTVVNTPLTVYSKWEAMQYTVTLDPGEGTVDPAQLTVSYGTPYGKLPQPVRKGYVFMGWTLGNMTITDTVKVETNADHTLVAVWQRESSLQTWLIPIGGLTVVTVFVIWYFVKRRKEERDMWST